MVFQDRKNKYKLMYDAVSASINCVGITDLQGEIIYVNDACIKTWGYNNEAEMIGRFLPEFWEGDGIFHTIKELQEKGVASGEDIGKKKDGTTFNISFSASILTNETGNPAFMFGSFFDITDHKKAEESLQKLTKELKQKTVSLEESNTALKVLLKHRDMDKKNLEEHILSNIQELIFPVLGKLKMKITDPNLNVYLEIIESNLNEISSPFAPCLSDKFSKLTPAETQIANFIKHGKTTKEIARVLNLSPNTIATQRQKIRKKLGLTNKKTNLQTTLTSS